MSKNQASKSEQGRVAALRAYDVLDTSPEQEFDNIAQLAADICNTPICVINLVDSDRLWFKATVGINGRELPRVHSFCHYTILDDEIFEVTNPLSDSRFVNNPLVTGPEGIRFYAGVPLVNKDGYRLGTLAVMSPRQHHQLNSYQRISITILASAVMTLLETRLLKKEATGLREAMSEAMAVAIVNADGAIEYANNTFINHTGLSVEEVYDKRYTDIKLADIPAESFEEIQREVSAGKVWHGNLKNQNIKGVITWTELAIVPTLNNDGSVHRIVYLSRDITDAVVTAQRLSDTEQLTHTGSWDLNVFNRNTTWTDGMYRLLGFDPVEERSSEQSMMNFVSPPDFEKVNAVNKKILDKHTQEEALEFRIITKQSTEKTVKAVVRKRHNHKSGLTSLYGTVTDITDLKKLLETIRQKDDLLRRYYDDAPIGYLSVDRDGMISSANNTFDKWLGIRQSHLDTLTVADITRPAESERFITALGDCKAGDELTITFTSASQTDLVLKLMCLGGDPYHAPDALQFSAVPLTGLVLARDTDSQDKEEPLLLPDELMVMLTNSNCETTYASKRLLETLGLREIELISGQYIFLYDEHWRHKALNIFRDQLRNADLNVVLKAPVRAADGSKVWMEITSALTIDEDAVTGLRQIFYDVNEYISAEESLREVAVMAMDTKERHLSLISKVGSHVQEPLKGITGMVNLLATTNLTLEQKVLLEAIKTTTEKVMNDLEPLADQGQMNGLPTAAREQDFEVKALIKKLIDQKKDATESIRYILNIDNRVPGVVHADPELLEKVLNHLLAYVLPDLQQGVVTFGVLLKEQQAEHAHLEFIIKLAGLPYTGVSHVLQAYTNTAYAIQEPMSGLNIARQLIEQHGTSLSVRADHEFSLIFSFGYHAIAKAPAAQQPFVAGNAKDIVKQPEGQPLAGCLILFVEDNIMSQRIGKATLENWGALVTLADRGNAAIDILRQKYFDVILMDLQMPEMSGIEATIIIRNELKLDTPILAMTVSEMQTKREACIKAGMNDYILKPLNGPELLKKITGLIGKPDTRHAERHPNIEYVKSITNNDLVLMKEVLEIYVNRTPGLLAEIELEVEKGNFIGAQAKVHYLKNSVGLIGADSLFHMLATIEELLNHLPPTLETLNLIETMKQTVRESIQETYEELKLL